MLGRITGTVRFREPLSFYTSLRIGGHAEFFVMPQDLNDVRYAFAFAEQEDLPLVVIGGGNNLLVSDAGCRRWSSSSRAFSGAPSSTATR